jgi:hypothetical protein
MRVSNLKVIELSRQELCDLLKGHFTRTGQIDNNCAVFVCENGSTDFIKIEFEGG